MSSIVLAMMLLAGDAGPTGLAGDAGSQVIVIAPERTGDVTIVPMGLSQTPTDASVMSGPLVFDASVIDAKIPQVTIPTDQEVPGVFAGLIAAVRTHDYMAATIAVQLLALWVLLRFRPRPVKPA